MKQRLSLLLRLSSLYLIIFALSKLAFLCYNLAQEPVQWIDLWQVWSHGLSMDLSTTGYLLVLPWLLLLGSLFNKHLTSIRTILIPYHIIVGLLLSSILIADTLMYGFWKFKLDSTIFAYMDDTRGATNSVSTSFLILSLSIFSLMAILIIWAAIRLTPKKLSQTCKCNIRQTVRNGFCTLIWLFLGGIIFLFIRGGWQESTMNVGTAYYSPRLYLNHAAVNPAFSLVASVIKNQDFSKQFQELNEETRQKTFSPLYAKTDTTLSDTLLNQRHPNILFILMESFGGQFVKELGGIKYIAPNISRLIPQGVFWDQMYAASFRTDRGTVCTFSGWVSYPTASLMRIPGRSAALPSIARSLKAEGYSTHFLYGGDINIMGQSGYLVATGYDRLISSKDFSFSQVYESKWGVNDSITAMRTLREIKALSTQTSTNTRPWHFVLQTLSSHEPYEVPYKVLENKIENAFAFTDHCIGMLIDSLRTLPLWKNTLVIMAPDHGSTYHSSYQNAEFFHCPMLWLGGALRQPRHLSVLMSQSDIAATLLGQLGIKSDDFPWSRNVLSRGYTYPFIYSSYPSGILFKDSTGVTLYDTNSKVVILDTPAPSTQRLQRAKAILQTSYMQLGKKKGEKGAIR